MTLNTTPSFTDITSSLLSSLITATTNITSNTGFDNNTSTSNLQSDENYFMNFWLDGIFKLIVGFLAMFMNSIAIWILVSQKKMQNMFLHILTCSLIFDNGYMLMEILCTLYWEFKVSFLVWILPYIAYPLKEIFYTSNILITLSLSYERYTLISDSKGYKQTMEIAKFRHQRLRKYLLFISLLSIGINLPSFFTHYVNSEDEPVISKTLDYKDNKKLWRIMDRAVKWSIILVTTFTLLVFFNWKLFTNIKEKLKMRHELQTFVSTNEQTDSNGITAEKKIRSRISMIRVFRRKEKFTTALFALVIAFFFCNIWFLGEVILKTVSSAAHVEDPGFETFLDNYEIISRLMRMLNSCTNVFIYCVVDRTFKTLFKYYLKRLAFLMSCKLIKSIEPSVQERDLKEGRINSTHNNSESQSRPMSSNTKQTPRTSTRTISFKSSY